MKNYKIHKNLIEMAWSDKISFEEIKKTTDIPDKEVINIMRKTLKKTVIYCGVNVLGGRPAKHRKLTKFKSQFPQK